MTHKARGSQRIARSWTSARQSRQKPDIDWLLHCVTSPDDRGLRRLFRALDRPRTHQVVRGGRARPRRDRSQHAPQRRAATLPRCRGDRERPPRIPVRPRHDEVVVEQCRRSSENDRGDLDRRPKMPKPEWPKARRAAEPLASSALDGEAPFGCSLEICPRTFISKNFDLDKLCRSLELKLF
jgi:hypothetical protein